MIDILKFNEYENDDEIKIGCLMLYFYFSNWYEYIRNLIKEEDLYLTEDEDDINNYGYENEPHCTILYGFHEYKNIKEDIKKYLPELEYFDDIFKGNISIFESADYDVVKFEIYSQKLINLNNTLRENFDYSNDFPEYKPHMTIAYVKKGKGKNYTKELEKVPIFGKDYIYSDNEYNKNILKNKQQK